MAAARCVKEFKQRLHSFLEAVCGCANSEVKVRAREPLHSCLKSRAQTAHLPYGSCPHRILKGQPIFGTRRGSPQDGLLARASRPWLLANREAATRTIPTLTASQHAPLPWSERYRHGRAAVAVSRSLSDIAGDHMPGEQDAADVHASCAPAT